MTYWCSLSVCTNIHTYIYPILHICEIRGVTHLLDIDIVWSGFRRSVGATTAEPPSTETETESPAVAFPKTIYCYAWNISPTRTIPLWVCLFMKTFLEFFALYSPRAECSTASPPIVLFRFCFMSILVLCLFSILGRFVVMNDTNLVACYEHFWVMVSGG